MRFGYFVAICHNTFQRLQKLRSGSYKAQIAFCVFRFAQDGCNVGMIATWPGENGIFGADVPKPWSRCMCHFVFPICTRLCFNHESWTGAVLPITRPSWLLAR